MDSIVFYDVKKRERVTVPIAEVTKKTYNSTTKYGKAMVRHAVKAEFEGSKLTKFVSKTFYDGLDVPTV